MPPTSPLVTCKQSGWTKRMGTSSLWAEDEENQWPAEGSRAAVSH